MFVFVVWSMHLRNVAKGTFDVETTIVYMDINYTVI